MLERERAGIHSVAERVFVNGGVSARSVRAERLGDDTEAVVAASVVPSLSVVVVGGLASRSTTDKRRWLASASSVLVRVRLTKVGEFQALLHSDSLAIEMAREWRLGASVGGAATAFVGGAGGRAAVRPEPTERALVSVGDEGAGGPLALVDGAACGLSEEEEGSGEASVAAMAADDEEYCDMRRSKRSRCMLHETRRCAKVTASSMNMSFWCCASSSSSTSVSVSVEEQSSRLRSSSVEKLTSNRSRASIRKRANESHVVSVQSRINDANSTAESRAPIESSSYTRHIPARHRQYIHTYMFNKGMEPQPIGRRLGSLLIRKEWRSDEIVPG